MRKIIVDLPASDIEKGGTPEQAALRELEEETGFTTEKLEWLGRFSWAPSNMEGCVEIFFAKDLRLTRDFSHEEIAGVEMMSFDRSGIILKTEPLPFPNSVNVTYRQQHLEDQQEGLRIHVVYLPRLSQSSFLSKSLTDDLIAELLLGYMFALTSSSKPSK